MSSRCATTGSSGRCTSCSSTTTMTQRIDWALVGGTRLRLIPRLLIPIPVVCWRLIGNLRWIGESRSGRTSRRRHGPRRRWLSTHAFAREAIGKRVAWQAVVQGFSPFRGCGPPADIQAAIDELMARLRSKAAWQCQVATQEFASSFSVLNVCSPPMLRRTPSGRKLRPVQQHIAAIGRSSQVRTLQGPPNSSGTTTPCTRSCIASARPHPAVVTKTCRRSRAIGNLHGTESGLHRNPACEGGRTQSL